MADQKRVMILTPFYPPNIGGAETFAEELARETYKKHRVTVLTYQPFKGKAAPVELCDGGVIHRMSWIVRPKVWRGTGVKNFFLVVPKMLMRSLVFNWGLRGFDTVHALGFNAGFIGAILKVLFEVRLVITPLSLYDFDNRLFRNVARWTMKRADVVFAESEISKQNLSEVTDISKISVFTHWVDTKRFYPVEHKNERLKVLFASRPLEEKGIDVIKQVEESLKGVDFIYATDVPNEEMPALFQMADVLVVPSLYPESPNRVVAEGAACGCIVVASDRGALSEQVKSFGIVIAPTIRKFKQIIDKLDKDRKLTKELRECTLAYAEENLTERNAERIIGAY